MHLVSSHPPSPEITTHSPEYRFVPSNEYVRDLIADIKGAQERINLQFMHMDCSHPQIQSLSTALIMKQQQSAMPIRLLLSKHSFHRQNMPYLNAMSRIGILVGQTDKHNPLIPFNLSGTNHCKFTLIDDVAAIGGMSLSDYSLSGFDFMMKTNNPMIVQSVTEHFITNNGKPPRDEYVACGDHTRLYFDQGMRGHSIIRDTMTEALKRPADYILVLNQFPWDGPLLHQLEVHTMADETNIDVVYGNPTRSDRWPFRTARYASSWLPRNRPGDHGKMHISYLQSSLHAKVLFIVRPDCTRELFFGSHNGNKLGVALGTAEAHLHTTDDAIIDPFLELIKPLPGVREIPTVSRPSRSSFAL